MFNTVHANHDVEGVTDRRISWIPDHMNTLARIMAEYALKNLTSFVELHGPQGFGDLIFYLDRDMGLVIANPDVELMPNLGLGEVIDGSPPRQPLKRKRCADDFVVPFEFPALDGAMCGPNVYASKLLKIRAMEDEDFVPQPLSGKCKYSMVTSSKDKEKSYEEYAFFANGSFTQKAIAVLDSGSLHFSSVFGDPDLDLETFVGNGLFAKDLLQHACLDTLGLVTAC